MGYAHSVETWHEGILVGGLYGISLGRCFFGESMFSQVSNASKAAFITLVHALQERGFGLVDCQVRSDHLLSLGAKEIPREIFLTLLQHLLSKETYRGNWRNIDKSGNS
jgi:leucyl/phenylalanyl-tRNA--protein transferase